ncbi:unnamed protein product [Dicrocoelium dendriticum]|nr:unnamed protein product [Dicrocoelium dendriticum]
MQIYAILQQVTTNRLSTPVIKMFTAQDYIEPTAYNVHWKNVGGSTEIDEYKISVRPVEVDYSMGEVNGRPIGEWVEYSPVRPNCASEDQRREAEAICQYRVENLKPDTAYELELSGHNNMGFSEAQRIIFRTSSLSGATGRMLNMPSYLQHTSSAPSRMKAQSMVHQVPLILSLIHVCSVI